MKSQIIPTIEVVFEDGDYSLIIRKTEDNPKWSEFVYKDYTGKPPVSIISFPNEDLDNIIKALQTYKYQVDLLD